MALQPLRTSVVVDPVLTSLIHMTNLAKERGSVVGQQLRDRTGEFGLDWSGIRPTPPGACSGDAAAALDFPFEVTPQLAPDGTADFGRVAGMIAVVTSAHLGAATNELSAVMTELRMVRVRAPTVGQRLVLRSVIVHTNVTAQHVEADVIDPNTGVSYYTSAQRKVVVPARQEPSAPGPKRLRLRALRNPVLRLPADADQEPAAEAPSPFRHLSPNVAAELRRLGVAKCLVSRTDLQQLHLPFTVSRSLLNLTGVLHGGLSTFLCCSAATMAVSEFAGGTWSVLSSAWRLPKAARLDARLAVHSTVRGVEDDTSAVVETSIAEVVTPFATIVTATITLVRVSAFQNKSKL